MFLRNLNVNSQNTGKDVWSTASSSYGFYSIPYEYPLGVNNLYYIRYTYKFTTTNQSPTWVQFYKQSGSAIWGSDSRISNPTAGTEYTRSAVGSMSNYPGLTIEFGTLYNGDSTAISGVSSQVKNVLVYDVTDLFELLKAAGVATTEATLKTWCDNNLEYSPRYTNYDITSKLPSLNEKIVIKKGTLITGNFVETDGMKRYVADSNYCDPYIDYGVPFDVYNNSGEEAVEHKICNHGIYYDDGYVQDEESVSPFAPDHIQTVRIETKGTASPGAGGFYCRHLAAANKIFIERFVAKVPVGYTVSAAYNSQGTGASVTYLTDMSGTGDWKEYAILYKCGSSGSFSTGGHVYITGPNNTNVAWYVAFCINCDITENEDLKYFTVLRNKERIKKDYIFSYSFDNLNLFPNGVFAKRESSMLPTGWYYEDSFSNEDDTPYYAYQTAYNHTNLARTLIVQPVGAGAGTVGPFLQIKPGVQYKISYWIYCKPDMTSFLTAIRVFLPNGTEYTHAGVAYEPGTKTQLTQDLVSGATTVSVKSNTNWKARSYSRLGFRSSSWKSYNDVGTSAGYNGSTGIVSGVTGTTTINLNTPYTGATIPANTYIVESYDGGTYPYPIQKNQLDDFTYDNPTWTYVEGYFGSNSLWDGSGGGWRGIPSDFTQIKLYLNIYTNDSSYPIKYRDIRIEPISAGTGSRNEQKIQLIESGNGVGFSNSMLMPV